MSQRSTRLLLIYSRLKAGPVTIELLQQWAQKYDIQISARTFYRDLLTLENSLILPDEKLVVSVGEKNRKIWKLEYEDSEDPLTEFDVNSYMLFKNFLPLPLVDSRQVSMHKMIRLFYRNFSKSHFEKFTSVGDTQMRATHFGEGRSFGEYGETLDDCIWSIQNKRELELHKLSAHFMPLTENVKFPLRFLPIQLLYHRGTVQLSGFIKDLKTILILPMNQIESYKLTNEQFDARDLIDKLETELAARFGISPNVNSETYDIVLEFAEYTGNYVKSQCWHPTQKFEQLPSGNHIMRLHCGVNRELLSWIFMWTSNVKVHQPDVLAELVLQKYRDAAALYADGTELSYSNSFAPVGGD